ncbi:general substrate transporter, partial [Aspergillus ellipticus CBS 707.79]
LPGLIAPFLAQMMAEKWGRRWPIWVGSVINIVGAVVNAASKDLAIYIAGRVLMGIGIAMGISIAPTLLQELAHPRYRAPLGSMYTSIYYIAAVISASICLGTGAISDNNAWRIPCYLQLVGPAATLALTIGMAESPRWLVMHGQAEKALDALARYHSNGVVDDPLVQLEYREIRAMLSADGLCPASHYGDLFKGSNRHRLIILLAIGCGTNWVGNGIITYYLASILSGIGITSSRDQSILNVGLQVWNLILSISAALSVDKIGRRPLWLTSTIGIFFALAIIMGLSGSYAQSNNSAVGIAVVPFLFIFFGFYVIAWTPLSNMYTVEVLPYYLRTKGQAVYCFTQNAANAFNQWVNPIALDSIEWRYYGLYLAVQAVLIAIIYFKFPETKNLTIEEIAAIFDGDR